MSVIRHILHAMRYTPVVVAPTDVQVGAVVVKHVRQVLPAACFQHVAEVLMLAVLPSCNMKILSFSPMISTQIQDTLSDFGCTSYMDASK